MPERDNATMIRISSAPSTMSRRTEMTMPRYIISENTGMRMRVVAHQGKLMP